MLVSSRLIELRAVFLVALMLCFVVGCYEHDSRGNESIYRFAWWVGPMAIAGGVLGIPVGWLLRKKWSPRWGFVLMVVAPVLLLIVGPAMYSDRVLIDDDHFEARYGFWFAPSRHSLRFDELREIQLVAMRGNRGRTNYELRCQGNTGQVSVVHVGDLLKNAVPEILTRARARGVRVVSQTP